MAAVLEGETARPRRVFYTAIVATLILVVLAGLLPSYVSRIDGKEPIPNFVHAHATVFSLWLLVMLALGYQTAIFGARRGHPFNFGPGAPFADSFAFLIVPLFDLVLFASVVGVVVIVVSFALRPAIGRSSLWHDVAAWLTR